MLIPPHDNIGDMTELTVSTTALTVAVPARANGILVQTKANNIVYTTDGSTPTAAHGHVVVALEPPLFVPISRNQTFKCIRSAGADATLSYQFVRAKNRY